MNELQIFDFNGLQIFDFNGQEVRTLQIDGEPYFVGKDVAEILGYERATKAVNDHVDTEDRDEVPIQTPSVECSEHLSLTNQVYTVSF